MHIQNSISGLGMWFVVEHLYDMLKGLSLVFVSHIQSNKIKTHVLLPDVSEDPDRAG